MNTNAYRADPPEARRVIALDGVALIFHRPSGLTHILAPPAPQILEALAEGDAEPAALLDRLKRDYDFGDSDDLEAALEARIAELEMSGLVWRA
ncbi:HPr-rel-A system PqqD family peptide chaperone [Parasphingopyxis lamellibrachiae]|uniref:PqqD family protein of HPr-rel-A system n=1 Tax=Parasphingopyxis lamellibrachiae TaxID=680125 RepID=A0A3D9FDI6_9SPHN|nr:HPr-rel-A system PqqD family peptide chaperone [Parasphingopyxis lamellibrachiae]RED15126.1 PqqD family protein of HPr-rel-A system [Parasphingopyxis lamellibrachiae]